MAKDSAARIKLGRSFHKEGIFNVLALFHCVVWLGTVQNGTAQFAVPLQFSTALEWAGLRTTAVTPEKL